MHKKLIIIGASGHGKVCDDIALEMNKWQEICFLDDNETIKTSLGLKVIGKSNDFDQYLDDYDFIVGVGGTVVKDIKDVGTYVGVPVRRTNEENTNSCE